MTPQLPPFLFVFDVESNGLFGPWFAVGYVVVNTETWTEVDCGYFGVSPLRDHWPMEAFVTDHVLPALPHPTHSDREPIRVEFLRAWDAWRARGAWLAADVPFPVEARFLDDVLRDARGLSPYPLFDIASAMTAAGMNPMATYDRLPDETPAHHPARDARQSVRLLRTALEQARTQVPIATLPPGGLATFGIVS